MSAPKKFYWMKQPSTFFQDPKIKKLRRIAGGDTYTIIYQKMMLLSIVSGGVIVHQEIEETLAKELSLVLDETEDNIKVTLSFMQAQGLIEELDSHSFLLPSVPALIGSETDSAERMRKMRERKASLCYTPVTVSYTELEKELELKKDSLTQAERALQNFQTFKTHFIQKNTNVEFQTQGIGYATATSFKVTNSGYLMNTVSGEILAKEEALKIWDYLYTYYKQQHAQKTA